MEYGLIGEHLGHSFSREIHARIGDYKYELKEIAKGDLDKFMKEKDFKGINVTIPYKQDVMPYLDYIDDGAKMIGAVNTIVNKDGKLYGYNTDFFGMISLIKSINLDVKGKKALILGTGGTSKTARAVLKHLGAKEIVVVSRNASGEVISYEMAEKMHSDAEIIVNTTPVGMYPNNEDIIIDLDKFEKLEGAIDPIYNPIRTKFIRKALRKGAKARGGLYMLVGQAIVASERFFDKDIDEKIAEDIYKEILSQKQNIILTGMPSCGKTTIGRMLAKKMGVEFVDADEYLVRTYQKEISEIFKEEGEKGFRDKESEVIADISRLNGCVISTGGGCILKDENIDRLRQNGKIYFIDRPLEKLIPTDDRPLSSNVEDIKKRYNERYDRYLDTCDYVVKNDKDIESVVEEIERKHNSWTF